MKKSIRKKRIELMMLANALASMGTLKGVEFGIFRKRCMDTLGENQRPIMEELQVTNDEMVVMQKHMVTGVPIVNDLIQKKFETLQVEEEISVPSIKQSSLPEDTEANHLAVLWDLIEFKDEDNKE